MKLKFLAPQVCWNLGTEEREEYLRQQLLVQLIWASEQVPFYQRLRLPLEDLKKLPLSEILGLLPIITKEMIQGRNPDFLATTPLPGHWLRTGGSTGVPTDIYHDREQIRWGKQSVSFARNWWGLRSGQKCFYVWGHSASLAPGWQGIKDRLVRPAKDVLCRRLRVNAYRMDQNSLIHHVSRLIKFQPEMVIGYTSSIYLIAQRFLTDVHNAKELPKLKGIIVTADPCYPLQAELIQAAFGVPVIIEYGSVEVGAIAYSHPDGTFRVLEDRFIVETIPNSEGLHELIMTDLSGRSHPLIRFAVGDQCQKPIDLPPEGIGFHILGAIEGRILDSIVGANGRRLHGVALSHIVNVCYPGILRYRFYQHFDGHLQVSLQLKTDANENSECEKYLLNYLQNELGAPIPINLSYVESFPQTLSGKFRWVVSEMPQNHTPNSNVQN